MSPPIAKIHDAFFKQALNDPTAARTFLQDHLPPDLVTLLGPELPVLMPGSFVDAQHHSDLLFRLRLNTGDPALAYVLLEHKSSPDPGARLQLLRYVVRILTTWHEQNDPQLPLPPVIPLVAHHGPQGWIISCEFTDLFGSVPEPLRPYLINFRHALVDLTRIDDGALSTQLRLRSFLMALKYMLRPDLPGRLDVLLAEASALPPADLIWILRYIDQSPVLITQEDMQRALNNVAPDRKERTVGIVQMFIDQGRQEGQLEGRTQGRREGRTEGQAKSLVRLLEKRFGAVSPALRDCIFAAVDGCRNPPDSGGECAFPDWRTSPWVSPTLSARIIPVRSCCPREQAGRSATAGGRSA